MAFFNKQRGNAAEDLAAGFLAKKGYRIIERNYKNPLGEIDIIAREKDTLCFIEVKFRSTDSKGIPEESINEHKKRKISQSALLYLKKKGLLGSPARFDVLTVLGKPHNIKLYKNAFCLSERYSY